MREFKAGDTMIGLQTAKLVITRVCMYVYMA